MAIRLPDIVEVFDLISIIEIDHLVLLNQYLPRLSLIQQVMSLKRPCKVINGFYDLDKIDCLEKDKSVPKPLQSQRL